MDSYIIDCKNAALVNCLISHDYIAYIHIYFFELLLLLKLLTIRTFYNLISKIFAKTFGCVLVRKGTKRAKCNCSSVLYM